MRTVRGRYRFARLAGVPPHTAAWRASSTLAIETICQHFTEHEYRRVNGSLQCWMCDAVKTPAEPGQHAGEHR